MRDMAACITTRVSRDLIVNNIAEAGDEKRVGYCSAWTHTPYVKACHP